MNITKQPNIVNHDCFRDALHDAVERQLQLKRHEVTESEINEWIFDHKGKLADELENSLPGVVSRVLTPKAEPTAPVISLNDGKIRLWAVDAHQPLKLAEHRSFRFGNDGTASLVYEERSTGHRASEVSIDDPSIWKWLQGFVDRAQQADELIAELEKLLADSRCPTYKTLTEWWHSHPEARLALAKAKALRDRI